MYLNFKIKKTIIGFILIYSLIHEYTHLFIIH